MSIRVSGGIEVWDGRAGGTDRKVLTLTRQSNDPGRVGITMHDGGNKVLVSELKEALEMLEPTPQCNNSVNEPYEIVGGAAFSVWLQVGDKVETTDGHSKLYDDCDKDGGVVGRILSSGRVVVVRDDQTAFAIFATWLQRAVK